MKKPASLTSALLLSALVYPGLGQMAQGRKRPGQIIVALTSVILLLFLYEFYQAIMQSLPVIEAMNRGELSNFEATEKIMLSLGDGKVVQYTVLLLLCWGISVGEILYSAFRKK